MIPADASAVASINLKSLASKAGLDDKENEAAKQKVLEALKSGMNAATFQQLEKVMKNPGESGIDVESPFYVFSSSSFPYPTVVGKVNNEDNLHASLDVMAKEQICQPISEADGYSFTTMNGGLLAFNNSTVLIVNVSGNTQTEKAKEAITNLLKQTADNSIVKSGAFQKMEKQLLPFCLTIIQMRKKSGLTASANWNWLNTMSRRTQSIRVSYLTVKRMWRTDRDALDS